MKIASHQLLAFSTTAQTHSFSKAADQLGITQSALSQRVANLEKELEVTLFIRDPSQPRLTEAGELLLRYCQTTGSLEQEVLARLQKTSAGYAGDLRIGTFSSFTRSVLLPSLAPFLRIHRVLNFNLQSYASPELANVLRSGQADFVISDFSFGRAGIVEHHLGREEYIVVESSKHPTPPDIFLDNNSEDSATFDFFQHQDRKALPYRRSFLGEVYGILEGVELGLGRAVMSRHIAAGNKKIKPVKGFKIYARPVILSYYEQPYYSDLHKSVIAVLTEKAPAWLIAK